MHGVMTLGRQKPGPKPKPGDRYPSGKLKPEPKQSRVQMVAGEVSPTAIRRMLDSAHIMARYPMLGTIIGQLLACGVLTSREASAGFTFAMLAGRAERHIAGKPRRFAKSPAYDAGFNAPRSDVDLDSLAEVDPALAERLKTEIEREKEKDIKAFNEVREAIPQFPRYLRETIERWCVDDVPVNPMYREDAIKMLRRIADVLKLDKVADEAPKPKKHEPSISEDSELYGLSAIETLKAWFKSIPKVKARQFKVDNLDKGQWQRIIATAVTTDGEILERKIDVRVHGMLGAALHRRLVAFGKSEGWAYERSEA
jgi:hypothetical protein